VSTTMSKRKYYDIAVIGGGPAGLSAAYEAAVSGARVCLIDENKMLGGQLFKQIHKFFGSKQHHAGTRGFRIANELVKNVMESGVDVYTDTICWGLNPGYELGVTVEGRETFTIEPKKIIVCTGAAENALAFPGSTLPGIIGAGAAQTLANIRRVRPGKRVVVVGSGNVGLIVSYQLMQAGVDVVALCEAAPSIGGYMVHASKIRRNGVEILTGHTITRAFGTDEVEGVEIAKVDEKFAPVPGTERRIDCDLVAIAVGLHPMADLCMMAGCEVQHSRGLSGFVPRHDNNMETSLHGIYIAGDVSGIEEASVAIEEGRLAGYAASESLGYIPKDIADELKKEARASLAGLRSGERGERIAGFKREIMFKEVE